MSNMSHGVTHLSTASRSRRSHCRHQSMLNDFLQARRKTPDIKFAIIGMQSTSCGHSSFITLSVPSWTMAAVGKLDI